MRVLETIIVGGGPAGSSCARELHTAGRECLVLERKAMPRVKLCAGWITPKVLTDLEFGMRDYPHGILKLDEIKVYWGKSRRHSKVMPTRQFSIRRVEFDAWLLERSGVEVAEHTVRQIRRDGGQFVIDEQFRCRHIVGAGGTNCPVKKHFFPSARGKLIIAQEIEFKVPPPSLTCTLWFPFAGSFGYAWYVPKADAVNIGFGGLKSQLTDWNRQALWEEFVDLLQGEIGLPGPPPSPKGYSYYIGAKPVADACAGAYLAGDAAGLATGDLAEGIGPAVESGIAAARRILGLPASRLPPTTRFSLSWSSRIARRAVAAFS
jgi:flavin-dependent dehydrogenase